MGIFAKTAARAETRLRNQLIETALAIDPRVNLLPIFLPCQDPANLQEPHQGIFISGPTYGAGVHLCSGYVWYRSISSEIAHDLRDGYYGGSTLRAADINPERLMRKSSGVAAMAALLVTISHRLNAVDSGDRPTEQPGDQENSVRAPGAGESAGRITRTDRDESRLPYPILDAPGLSAEELVAANFKSWLETMAPDLSVRVRLHDGKPGVQLDIDNIYTNSESAYVVVQIRGEELYLHIGEHALASKMTVVRLRANNRLENIYDRAYREIRDHLPFPEISHPS